MMDWISHHPHWALVAIFVVSLTESLAVVGLVVPGALVMIGAGALIGLGALGFWAALIVAVAGAITGDGISYWIGRHYADRLRTVWPFMQHPKWLARGEAYFLQHGGKSIFFGRFVGPVRPFIPVVAGMLGMRPAIFYRVNILSAFAWAPAYLIPGMVFGASLALAGEVAARLTVLILLLVGAIWGTLLLIRWLYRELSPRAGAMAQVTLVWTRRRPWMNRVFGGLLDPSQVETKTLLVLGILLIAASGLFIEILEEVISGEPLVRADQGVYQFLQDLRTPWADRLMIFFTELGDGVVVAVVSGVVLLWLLWRRNWRAATYWIAAVGFGQLAAMTMKVIVQRPRPLTGLYDGLWSYAFPSGHAIMSMVVYGYLAILIAGQVSTPRRWLTYATAVLLVSAIAVSRLYLGAHWFSDVIGGLSLGLAWISLLGIAYYRHPAKTLLPRSLPAVAMVALLLAGSWHVSAHYVTDLQRYAPHLTMQHLPATWWWRDGWRELPNYRQDIEGGFEQPLNVQWHGSPASLREKLRAQGWRDPVPATLSTALRWLKPDPDLGELPLLPQVHAGRDDALRMVYPLPAGRQGPQQVILRLWSSGVILEPDGEQLWIGSVSHLTLKRLPLLSFPIDDQRYAAARAKLTRSLRETDLEMVVRERTTVSIKTPLEQGVLLIREKGL